MTAIGMGDLLPGDRPGDDQGQERHGGDDRGDDRRGEPLARSTDDECDAGGNPVPLERPVAIDREMIPPRGDRQHGQKRRECTERHPVPREERRQHAAGERGGKHEEHESGEPPALERRLEQEQDADRRGEARAEHPPVQGVGALVVAHHLCVVLEREVGGGEAAVDLGYDRARIAPADVEADLDPA